MSIDNKNIQIHEDYLVQQAIHDGTQIEEEKQEQYLEVKFTNAELQKIQELTASLRLSKEAFIESAISYLYFRFINNQENIQNLINEESKKYEYESQKIPEKVKLSSKERDRFFTEIELSPEIFKKLEELNMLEKINQCLFTGINLLYKQLIEDFKPLSSK